MTRILAALAALAVIASSQLATASLADAHEKRAVGPYEVEVGWDVEPAFAGSPNAVFLEVKDGRTSPPTPVAGLAATLKVEVRHGGLTRAIGLSFETDVHDPGTYRARFVPTRAGDYAFDLVGKIGDQDVKERFESGPGRFDSVAAPAAVQYPDAVPAGGELRDRLDAIERDIGQVRAFALVALALAIVLPIGNAVARRRTRT